MDLSTEQIQRIERLALEGLPRNRIVRATGLSAQVVSSILRQSPTRSYRHNRFRTAIYTLERSRAFEELMAGAWGRSWPDVIEGSDSLDGEAGLALGGDFETPPYVGDRGPNRGRLSKMVEYLSRTAGVRRVCVRV